MTKIRDKDKKEKVEKILKSFPGNYKFVKFQENGKRTLVQSSLGLHLVYSKHLLNGVEPSFRTVVDKTSYIKKWCQLTHGDKYDYSLVEYINDITPIKIICPEHGVFETTIGSFLRSKCECKKCSTEKHSGWTLSKWKDDHSDYRLYICRLYNNVESFIKIGRTKQSFNNRKKGFKPYGVELIGIVQSKDAEYIYNLEKEIKTSNQDMRYIPQIKFGGYTECYNYKIIKDENIWTKIDRSY